MIKLCNTNIKYGNMIKKEADKMRYFVQDSLYGDEIEKTLIIAKPGDLVEKIELGGLTYVHKDDIENIGEYRFESIPSKEVMEVEDAVRYLFLASEVELTGDERSFIEKGYIDIEDMDMFEDIDLENISNEEYKKVEKDAKEKLTKSIIEKMKKESCTAKDLEIYVSYDYWDGSNSKSIPVKHWYYDVEWLEYTEEFEGMEQIDKQSYSTGHYELYRLKDETLILIDNSYYQKNLCSVVFIEDKEIKTVDEALEYIDNIR